jgi:hypothetical protein
MTDEDRLREILHSEATTVVPSGDGLAVIRARVARRHRLHLMLLPAGALVTAAAVIAFFSFTGAPATQKLITPATRPPVTPTPTPTPTATAEPTATGPVAPYTGPALWPFTSVAQGQAWMADHGARPWAGDPLAVGQHLLTDLLKVQGVTASGTAPSLLLTVQGKKVGVVHVVQVFRGGPWTVVGVGGTDLTITTPAVGAKITSPTKVSGRVVGVDENVQLRLITATGKDLANAGAPAGSEVPWEGTLTWSDQTWFTAGIVAITRSAKDGEINRITVVVVKRT